MLKVILLGWLLALMPPLVQDDPVGDCAGLVEPRLEAGQTARARFNDGIGLVFRDGAGTEASGTTVIDNLPEGVVFTVQSGPICNDEFVWWSVRLADGREGFIAEGGTEEGGYYVEAFPLGTMIFRFDENVPTILSRFWVTAAGEVEEREPLVLEPQSGTVAELWQEPEIELANIALANRIDTCPEVLSPQVANASDISNIFFANGELSIHPSEEGGQAIIFRDYLIDIPTCEGVSELYGTTYVSLASATDEAGVFPYSQHSAPPESRFCQTPLVVEPEYVTYMSEVAWSQDGRYVALDVRYLRANAQFPCAFYHVFVVNTSTQTVSYAGEGRRIGWGQGGRRLRYVRVQKTDPNLAGEERMFSLRPDGQDEVEIFLPDGATWVPGAVDILGTVLPWSASGDALLVCNGEVYTCSDMSTFRVEDSSFITQSISLPAGAQMGSTLESVQYVAGDSQLLWLSTDGRIFLQEVDGGAPIEIRLNGVVDSIVALPTGVGAVLVLEDDRYFYLDVLSTQVTAIEDIN